MRAIALFRYSDLTAVCFAIFVLNIGYGMLTPVLPIYANGLGLPVMMVGVMFSVFALAKMVCATPAGFLSDIYTDKRMLLIANSTYAIATFLFTLTDNPYLFVIFRALEGIAEGLALPAMYSVIARSVPEGERGEAIGTLVTFSTAGSALGPMVGGIAVSNLGYHSIFYATSIAALCTTVIILKGVTAVRLRPLANWSFWNAFGAEFKSIYRGNTAALLYGLGLLVFFVDLVYSALQSTGPLYMRNQLASSVAEVGLFFTVNFIIFAFFSPIGGKLTDIIGARRQATIAAAGLVIFMIAASFATSYPLFLGLFIGEFFMATLLFPATQVLAASLFPNGARSGKAYGILNTVRSLGLLIGPLVGATVLEESPTSLFLVLGMTGIFCLIVFVGVNSRSSTVGEFGVKQ